MLRRIEHAKLPFAISADEKGQDALKFPDPAGHTAEQRNVAVDVMIFAIGYPRCFGTLKRLIRDREIGA